MKHLLGCFLFLIGSALNATAQTSALTPEQVQALLARID